MAESNNKSGILALAQKRISRTKTKVLQNLGKAERTTDDVFNDFVARIDKQQETAHHLQKELKNYAHCLREMCHASKSLTLAITEVYEPEWTKESAFKTQIQVLDLLWNDCLQSVQDNAVTPIHNYLQSFPVLKTKIAKRGRKMVDYDNSRHTLEVLHSAKKKDDARIQKALEDMREAKRIYDELNNELHTELPEFHNSRITFYSSLLSNLFCADQIFHSEVGKASGALNDICQELSKDFEQFVYQPKRDLSKSTSLNSGENGFSDMRSLGSQSTDGQYSASNSHGKETSQPVYNNQDENKSAASSPAGQLNGGSQTPLVSRDSKLSQNVAVTDNGSQKVSDKRLDQGGDESPDEIRERVHNVYEDPKETNAASAAFSSIKDTNHRPQSSSEDDDDDDSMDDEEEEPTYSNPPSNLPVVSPPDRTLYTVQATHKYTGEDVDELSFEPGEIIFVLPFEDPDEQDDGWQMGVRASDGVLGVFPENFTHRI